TKHHHMLYYLTFLLSSMGVLAVLMAALLRPFETGGPPPAVRPDGEAVQQPRPGHPEAPGNAEANADGKDFFNLWNHTYLQAVPMMGLLLAYVFVVFGFVSRRCERQADIYGCRAVSCGQRDCLGHNDVAGGGWRLAGEEEGSGSSSPTLQLE